MSDQLQRMLRHLSEEGSERLKGILHGIEKEGLRVDAAGRLSQREHPKALGSALTHSRITTDYSEALLEFITPVFSDAGQAIAYLEDLHRFCYEQLDDELIWSASMPCGLSGPDEIPIARYGSSHIGRLKHIYRVGLESRYGRVMQSIAGIHYNFSLSAALWPSLQAWQGRTGESLQDFQSGSYFALIRNFRRYSWLLIYLFGASPAMSRSFIGKGDHQLEALGEHSLYGRYATSLRMSDLGYSNQAQSQLNICYNTLDNYVHTLSEAITTPYAPYQKLGVKVDGAYRQLNSNLLQIENEYYSDIRPKRVIHSGEKPIHALRERGVEYVEVRSLDINPYLPVGIDGAQAHFLDTFLLFCLLADAPDIADDECTLIRENHQRVVRQGRDPALKLRCAGGGEKGLGVWGRELLDRLLPVAELLDQAHGNACYSKAVVAQRALLEDPELTPSGRVLNELLASGKSYEAFVLQRSAQHRDRLLAEHLAQFRRDELQQMVGQSLSDQAELERQSDGDFDRFLADYLAS